MAFGAREVRLALRSLARQRALTAAVIVTLGLGMGAGTAIYTLLRRIVLDPLPYPSAERLVRIKNPVPGVGADEEWDLSSAQFFYYAAHVRSLAAIGAYKETGMSLAADEPRRVIVARVTASMMRLLGARVARGRLLDARDDAPGAPRVAVISYALWRARGSRVRTAR